MARTIPYIRITRAALDSPALRKSAVVRGLLTSIVEAAAWRPADGVATGQLWTTNAELAEWAGVSPSTVKRIVIALRAAGLIETESRKRGGLLVTVPAWVCPRSGPISGPIFLEDSPKSKQPLSYDGDREHGPISGPISSRSARDSMSATEEELEKGVCSTHPSGAQPAVGGGGWDNSARFNEVLTDIEHEDGTVTVQFHEVPAAELTTALRSIGFGYHGKTRRWFASYTPERWRALRSLAPWLHGRHIER
jgi:hypothetical protein